MELSTESSPELSTDSNPKAVPKIASARPAPVPRMPNFAGGTHAHSHSVDSALASLGALGVPPSRVLLHRAGRDGHVSGSVVRQKPPAGAVLEPGTLVCLEIAGLGFTHALPVGMWDSGGEAAVGTRELFEGLDDPLEKLRHWFREGAPLFRIAPDDPGACSRWLALFGVQAADWPEPLWYRLASLIAQVPQLACSENGCARVLDVLLGLPVARFGYHPTETLLPPSALSLLGTRDSLLGVDLVLGNAVEDLAYLEIEIGPVPLPVYERYMETENGHGLLQQVLKLILPLSSSWDLVWLVEDRKAAPRLGVAGANSRLGVNTHMGGGVRVQQLEANNA